MPEIDQWKGYGSMEKGLKRLKQQEDGKGNYERSEQADVPSREGEHASTNGVDEKPSRAGRSRRRRRDDPSEDRRNSVTTRSGRKQEEQKEDSMERDGVSDAVQLPPPRQRHGRTSGGGGRGRGRGGRDKGRADKGRSINTSGLREENLRSGDVSPALSGVSGGGSPAHSIVNGDDIERWTRRQRMQRQKLQKREEEATGAERGTAATNGGEQIEDAVMHEQARHGWMQRVT